LRPKLALDVDHVEHFLRSRRSVRHFEQRAVDRATLSRLIAIARYAPTGHNAQSVRWTVVDSPAGVREMARITMDFMRSVSDEERALPLPAKELVNAWDSGIDIVGRDAPALVVAYVATEDPVAFADPVLALSYLELAAPSFGLGACWNGFFMATISQWPPLRHALGLPEGRMSLGAVLLGYPEYGYQRLPSRRPPRITWAE
jgi:nitroreductase